MAAANRVLVYGGKGALGSACVKYFRSKGWVSGNDSLIWFYRNRVTVNWCVCSNWHLLMRLKYWFAMHYCLH